VDSSQWLRKPGPRGNYGGSWTLGFELTAGVGAEGVATNNFARAPFRPRLGWQILEPPHSLHVLSGAGAEGRASAVPSLHLPLSAPLALVRASEMLAPLHCLHVLLMRWCGQRPEPPQSLHLSFRHWCGQMLAPLQSLHLTSGAVAGRGAPLLAPILKPIFLLLGMRGPVQILEKFGLYFFS